MAAPKKTAAPVKKAPPKIMSAAANPQTSPAAIELAKVRDYYAKNGHIPTLLANESKKRFGTASAADLSDLGKQVALGKISKDAALAQVRQGTKGIDDLHRRAGMATSLEIDPAEEGIRANLAQLDAAFKSSSAQNTALGNATAARQKAIYDMLQQEIAKQPGQIQQQYGETSAKVGGNFDAALAATQQNFAAAQQGVNNEASRLGLEAAAPVAVAQSANDSNFIQGLLQSQKLGAQGTLANLQQAGLNASQSFGNSMSAESAGIQTGTLGEFAHRQQEALLEKTAQDSEYNSKINQLEATRQPKLYETLQALQEARQQQIQDDEDRRFEQYIAEQTLGVKQTDSATKQYAAQTDRQKVEVASRLSEAQLQKIMRESVPGTLEYETAKAGIELKKAQAVAAVTNAKTGVQNANTNATKVNNAASKNAQYGKGMVGVGNYLADSGVDKQTHDTIMKHVNNTIITHANGDYAGGLRGVEGYIRAHKLSPEIANIFRIATAIAYGKA